MLKIGLTGGMGSGKSEVRRMLQQRGIPTIDADSLAKQIAATDTRAIAAIRAAFGDEVYDDAGELQRQVLAQKVFGDAEALAKLNGILHPLVFEYVDVQLRDLQAQEAWLVVIEAALFYESGWDAQMDAMVVVTAPLPRRIAWLRQRDGSSEAAIRARMRHQLPAEEKARRADYCLDNSGSLAELAAAVDAFLAWARERAQTAS